jgi:hypothetical protein
LSWRGQGFLLYKTPAQAKAYLTKNKDAVCRIVNEVAGYVRSVNPGLNTTSLSAVVVENQRNGSSKIHTTTSYPIK